LTLIAPKKKNQQEARDVFLAEMFYLKSTASLSAQQLELVLDTIRQCIQRGMRLQDVPMDSRTVSSAAWRFEGKKKVLHKDFEIDVPKEGVFKAVFQYFDPLEQFSDLLEQKPSAPRFDQSRVDHLGRKEIEDGDFWKHITRMFDNLNQTLDEPIIPVPVFLYTDGTTVGKVSVKSPKPIYISTGNYSIAERFLYENKRIIGFMPKFEEAGKSEAFKAAKRKLQHEVWQFIIDAMKLNDECTKVTIKDKHYFPVLCLLALDHPEAMLVSGIKDSHKALYPCRMCLVRNKHMSILRPYSQVQGMEEPGDRSIDTKNGFGEQPERSPFNDGTISEYFHQRRGVFWMTPSCSMHTFAQGMSKYVKLWVTEIVKQNGFGKKINQGDNKEIHYQPPDIQPFVPECDGEDQNNAGTDENDRDAPIENADNEDVEMGDDNADESEVEETEEDLTQLECLSTQIGQINTGETGEDFHPRKRPFGFTRQDQVIIPSSLFLVADFY